MLKSILLTIGAAALLTGCTSTPATSTPAAPASGPTADVQGTVRAQVAATVGAIPKTVATTAAAPKPVAPTVAPPVAPTAVKPAQPANKTAPITIDGTGIMRTPPFELAGGNYTITWKATDSGPVGCYHGGSLRRVDGTPTFDLIGNEMVPAGKTATGTTQAYNLRAGGYYLDMSSGCAWSVTIAAQ